MFCKLQGIYIDGEAIKCHLMNGRYANTVSSLKTDTMVCRCDALRQISNDESIFQLKFKTNLSLQCKGDNQSDFGTSLGVS